MFSSTLQEGAFPVQTGFFSLQTWAMRSTYGIFDQDAFINFDQTSLEPPGPKSKRIYLKHLSNEVLL